MGLVMMTFPPPTPGELRDYLKWDDWRVLGQLADGKGGEHGERLASRNHYREVYHTPETPDDRDLEELAPRHDLLARGPR